MTLVLTTLGDLPVGAFFTRHDQWGDCSTLYVKVNDHSWKPDDHSACCVQSTYGVNNGPLLANIKVQRIRISPDVAKVLFCLSNSLFERELIDAVTVAANSF